MRAITRREFLHRAGVLGLSASAAAMLDACGIVPIAAPTPRIFRIGELSLNTRESRRTSMEAFHQGLRELGYVEGQNIGYESRYAEGDAARLPAVATELVNLKVDIILAEEGAAALSLKQLTSTIPIVIAQVADPVGAGLVASIAHPGGNVTGIASDFPGINGKRLELLLQAVPDRTRVAVLWNKVNLAWETQLTEENAAGKALGVQLQFLEIKATSDFEGAFKTAMEGRADALYVNASPFFTQNLKLIADLAATNRLPALSTHHDFPANGGMMSYGVNLDGEFRSAARFVDKILKGAKPADLPFEQPTQFELSINLKTAKQLGLTIPTSVLAQATEVIQ